MPEHGPEARTRRLLQTLEQLLAIDALELAPALSEAALRISQALEADKVDAFLYQPENQTLVALGVSDTPMGRKQLAIGMDRLPLANRGLTVDVFQSGKSFATGHADREPGELLGILDGLGVRSELIASFEVDGQRRGVLQALSAKVEYFHPEEDLPFLEAVARWVGIVARRAELVQQKVQDAVEAGRDLAATDLLNLLTPRQREVAALVALGLTNEEIGRKLFLTAGSVANHVERIRTRLGVSRRTQIAVWAAQLGLLSRGNNGAGSNALG